LAVIITYHWLEDGFWEHQKKDWITIIQDLMKMIPNKKTTFFDENDFEENQYEDLCFEKDWTEEDDERYHQWLDENHSH